MNDIKPLLVPASNRVGRDAFGPQNRPGSNMCAALLVLTPEVAQTLRQMSQQARALNPENGQGQVRWVGQSFRQPDLMYWVAPPADHEEVRLRAGKPMTQQDGEWTESDPPPFSLRLAQAEHYARALLIAPELMEGLKEQDLLQSSWNTVSIEAAVDDERVRYFELSDKEINLGPIGWPTFLQAELSFKQGRSALQTWHELFNTRPRTAKAWLRRHSGQLQKHFGQEGVAQLLGHDEQTIRRIALRESKTIEPSQSGGRGRS